VTGSATPAPGPVAGEPARLEAARELVVAARPATAARSRRRKQVRTAIVYLLLIAGAVVMMAPFLWMVVTSFKTRAEVFGSSPFALPTGIHLENYARMWDALPFGSFYVNSLKLALLTTLGQLISCSMAAFAFAVLDFRGKRLLFGLLLATLIIPFQVVLVPNFILYRLLPHPFSVSGNWIGTQEPLWVGAFLGGAFGTFLLRQYFLTIPRELADAARVDGANPWQIFRHLYVPLAKPALATLAIFTFMWTWNDLINPLIYLKDLPTYTVTVGLAFFKGQFVGKWPEMMAGALVSLLPMIALFILAQRQFVRGITLTGIKG
jgi:multiple sugar transport system permease protein